MHQTHDLEIDLGIIEQSKYNVFPNHKTCFYKYQTLLKIISNEISKLKLPIPTNQSKNKNYIPIDVYNWNVCTWNAH